MWRRIAPAERDATAPDVAKPSRAAWRGLVTACVLLAPLAAWAARYAGWSRSADALALATIGVALAALARALGVAAAIAGALVVAAFAALAFVAGVPAVNGPPVAINLAVAALFAASLWRGEPLVTRFARAQGDAITPQVERYTQRLTVVWAAYLAALAAAGILIALHGDERWGAWWSGLVDYLLVAALFVGELAYRHRSMRGLVDQVRSVRAAMRGRSA